MGLAMANLRQIDMPARRPFFETLIQLIIGVLFVSISATITPQSLRHVVLPALGLVAVLVLIARPVVALVATLRTGLTRGERGFVGWMAPRGIVAAATASTFSVTLISKHINGATKILPATFVVIVATVTIYGLTAEPVARRLGVMRPARTRPLLVGGDPWVIDIGRALQSAGLDVLVWAGPEQQRAAIRAAGLELAPGELIAVAAGGGARLEGITAVLLLTSQDDFNALASAILPPSVDGPVHVLGPPPGEQDAAGKLAAENILFGPGVSRSELAQWYRSGARVVMRPVGVPPRDGEKMLFVVRGDGRLDPVTADATPAVQPGDTAILLATVPIPAS